MLCYNVQGRNYSVFNLIGCSKFNMNAEFVPDAKRPNVTWMRTIGVVLDKALRYKDSRVTGFKLDSKEHTVHIGNKLALSVSSIKEISSQNGTITLVRRKSKYSPNRHPDVKFNLKEVGLHFTVKYESDHLDIFWHMPLRGSNCHGLIGRRSDIYAVHSCVPISCHYMIIIIIIIMTLYYTTVIHLCRSVFPSRN